MKVVKNPLASRRSISANDEALMTAALAHAQKRATARVFDHDDVLEILSDIDDKLGELGIARSNRNGVSVRFCAGSVCNSYDYPADASWIIARHNGKEWRITSIYRDTSPQGPHGHAKTCWINVPCENLYAGARAKARHLLVQVTNLD